MTESATLAKGTYFCDRASLLEALEQWVSQTNEDTIGDPSFGRAPWISFDTTVGIADLNADTTRSAIERMLKSTRMHQQAPWQVIENRRGNINKIAFDLRDTHEGWYAYLRQPLAEPTTI